MSFRIKGTETACGTTVGAASTFNDSTDVRLFNSGSTNRLLTVADSSDTTIGTMTLADGEVTFIRKDKTDQIFAAHAEILGTAIVWS